MTKERRGELSQARQGQDQGDAGQQAGGVREHGGCDEERGRAGGVSTELFRFSIMHPSCDFHLSVIWDECHA